MGDSRQRDASKPGGRLVIMADNADILRYAQSQTLHTDDKALRGAVIDDTQTGRAIIGGKRGPLLRDKEAALFLIANIPAEKVPFRAIFRPKLCQSAAKTNRTRSLVALQRHFVETNPAMTKRQKVMGRLIGIIFFIKNHLIALYRGWRAVNDTGYQATFFLKKA